MRHPAERFPTTQWSVVTTAQGAPTPHSREALERLFESYWYPVYAFIRSRTSHADQAEDLTQGFFASLLDRHSLDSVRPEYGRFRAFLLASAKHYLSVERARSRTSKRGGGRVALPLDFYSADQRYRLEASPDENPDVQYECQWARTVFDSAAERLRREFAAAGKAVHFEAYRAHLIAGDETGSYRESALALEMTENAVKVAVHRARRRFAALLREQIGQTVSSAGLGLADCEAAINEEMAYLLRVLNGQ
jgi:RNA polymerase sigma factor (sigma-70 family)